MTVRGFWYRGGMLSVFTGPQGVRSGWRVTLFLLLAMALAVIAGGPLHYLAPRGTDALLLLQQAAVAIAAATATWIIARVESRPFISYGLGPVYRGRNLIAGLAAGFIALATLMGVLVGGGFYRLARTSLQGAELVQWVLYWLLVFVCVGFAEEMLMRGYALFTLARNIGFWPGAAIVSALFGLGHIGNSGEEVVGIANACLAGLVFAYSVRWTGSLWWAIGCHISWDWAETFFFGVADSGVPARHSWMLGTPAGPVWLSGGTVGPEGSILAAAALMLLIPIIRYTAPRYRAPELDRLVIPTPVSVPCEIPPPASEA